MTLDEDGKDRSETDQLTVGDIYDVATISHDEVTDDAEDPSETAEPPTVGDVYDVTAASHHVHKTTEKEGEEGSALKIIR